jgi:hypothetical protein
MNTKKTSIAHSADRLAITLDTTVSFPDNIFHQNVKHVPQWPVGDGSIVILQIISIAPQRQVSCLGNPVCMYSVTPDKFDMCNP